MELTTMYLSFNTNNPYEVDIPLHCPYCGKSVEFTAKQCHAHSLDNKIFYSYLLYAKCCKKHLIVTYLYEDEKFKFLSMYPNPLPSALPNGLHKISPRFIRLYADSERVYSDNMFELAGSGFRNALEILIKDYAIVELGEDKDKISKMDLFTAIDKFLPDPMLKNAADVVRILGNDYTHYERKYEQYDVDLLKTYLDIFIKRIDANYLMNHPPVSRSQKN